MGLSVRGVLGRLIFEEPELWRSDVSVVLEMTVTPLADRNF